MGLEMDVEGLEDVLERLQALDGEQILRVARAPMYRELEAIRQEATSNCPRDTGELRQSIKTRTRLRDGELRGEVYTNKEYAIYVEMGTGPRGEASHEGVSPELAANVTYSPKGWTYKTRDGEYRHTRGMPARPFLYPAVKAHEEGAKARIARTIIRAIREGKL